MTVAILLAPATRVGYLLYPVDFFVWAWLLRSEDTVDPPPEARRDARRPVLVGASAPGEPGDGSAAAGPSRDARGPGRPDRIVLGEADGAAAGPEPGAHRGPLRVGSVLIRHRVQP